jgi:hypothetical protein
MQSYWGLFGGVNVPMPDWVYFALNALAVLSAVGLVIHLARKFRADRFSLPAWLPTLLAIGWVAAVVLSLIRWATVTWSSQGRLVFGAISAISTLFVLGLATLVPRRGQAYFFGALGLCLFGLSAFAPFAWIASRYALPPAVTQAQLDGFFDVEDPHAPAAGLLASATTRSLYDLDRFNRTRRASPADPVQWLPVYVAALARETHAAEPPPPGGLKIQITFTYSDGFGREIQKKVQAEPGPLVPCGPVADPRWVGSGWTIYNNKGKPVRQYEPFFSQLAGQRHRYEFGVLAGVSATLFYDPLERVVAILHPNHTYEKFVFDAWQQASYDVNDTVLHPDGTTDPRLDPDVGGFFAQLPEPAYVPTWYEQRLGLPANDPERVAAEKTAPPRGGSAEAESESRST